MKKIIISDSVDEKSVDILQSAGFEVNYSPGIPADDLKKIIKEYNALIVRSSTKVTPELISEMENMEVIGRAGTGVDNINVEAATRKGIMVMNTPGGNTISTAEHAMALMLSMCRNIPQADNSLKEGRWDRKKYKGTEVLGKTLGIIGLGKIGKEVAVRAKAFGMKVIGYDPFISNQLAEKLKIELTTLDNLFSRSEIITLHVPLNDETKNIISKDTLDKCKDGVKVINCARGGLVNEADLIEAIDSGKVSAAAFDVYPKEPPDPESSVLHHPKIVVTPHLGASTEEAQEKVAIQISEQIADLFNNQSITGAINAAAISLAGNKKLLPYVKLAESIGALHAQLLKGQLQKININFSGDLLHTADTLLSTSVLKGFLSKKKTETVNLINAPWLAKEMGIIVNETKSGENSIYTNLLTVEFGTEKEKRSLAGTVYGNNEIRVVSIGEFHVELKPEGFMLLYTNIDRPGMLANVGKVLADAEINIAGLSLGRFKQGKEALTVINVDSKIDEDTLKKISSIEGVNNVFSVGI